MAAASEEEVEYESDAEEVKRSLGMRRREAASDDEDGDAKPGMDRKAVIHSDESDGQGGAAEYNDEEEEYVEEEEEVYDDDEEEIDDQEHEEEERDKEEIKGNRERGGEGLISATLLDENILQKSNDGNIVGEEEEEKEHEPFAVPTAGAFYMHDDRFRDNARGRQRRMQGPKKLWESQDDRKWGHDKFEETLQEKHYGEGKRSSRGRYRARSRNQGVGRGLSGEGRSRSLITNNNQTQAPRTVRGRGPRRYEPAWKRANQEFPTQIKQSGKPPEKISQSNPTRAIPLSTCVESASVPARKHVASSLNSASPPFFPSGSSNKDVIMTQKKDMQAANVVGNHRSPPSQANALRGKNLVDSIGMESVYIDESRTSANGKPLTNLQMLPSGSASVSFSQASRSKVHGSSLAIPGQFAYRPVSTKSHVNSSPAQLHAVHRRPPQSWAQSSVQALPQQVGHRPGVSSKTSSPPKTATSVNSFEPGEVESSFETSKPKGVLVGKGNGSFQGTGGASFLYGGSQVMGAAGNMSVSPGDQNFPAFLPVMQFGGQRPGGMGVPAVGMAFPGYVGPGNSEMTWLPVLTGAAGALGATYCPPYISVDGAYHARPSGQTSSTGSSSKEINPDKSNNEWKSSEKSELASDELEQRQNNPNKQPRRYSEMSFSK